MPQSGKRKDVWEAGRKPRNLVSLMCALVVARKPVASWTRHDRGVGGREEAAQ